MGAIRAHEVIVEFRGRRNVRTDRVLTLDIDSDMLELADRFSLTVPWSTEMQEAACLDAEVSISFAVRDSGSPDSNNIKMEHLRQGPRPIPRRPQPRVRRPARRPCLP